MRQFDMAEIRDRYPLTAIAGASTQLLRRSGRWIACCPLHPDRTPSFTIFQDGHHFRCFGCGAHGDVVDYVQQLHGVDFREALSMLTGDQFPAVKVRPHPPRPDRDTVYDARVIWRRAGPIAGTPAEAYLRNRGIHYDLPPSLRFARLRHPGQSNELPCLVALVTNPNNEFGGIQRTFVREDGTGKADVKTPKLSLGRVAGGSIRLAPPGDTLIVTGGLEDGLTLHQQTGVPVWSVTGEANMASLVLASHVERVVIGADNDAAGRSHSLRAAESFSDQGAAVSVFFPSEGFKDHNAQLQGIPA